MLRFMRRFGSRRGGWCAFGDAHSCAEQEKEESPAQHDQRFFEKFPQHSQEKSQNNQLKWTLGIVAVVVAIFIISQLPFTTSPLASLEMEFVRINPGTFMMGSPSNEAGRWGNETQHQVTISRGFELGKYEVTQGQWKAVMGSSPSYFKNCGADCPVEQVSWIEVQDFIMKLNAFNDGYRYRLPTEAEWEYAARAGTTAATFNGNLTIKGQLNAPELDAIAWYGGNSGVEYDVGYDSSIWEGKQYQHSRAGTHPVGQKRANPWGLYDMIGNVWVWCQDRYGDYPGGSVTDPTGPSSGSDRVIRGSGWLNSARHCRSAHRLNYDPGDRYDSIGFRLLRQARAVQKLEWHKNPLLKVI